MKKSYACAVGMTFGAILLGMVTYLTYQFNDLNREVDDVNAQLSKVVVALSDVVPTDAGYGSSEWLSIHTQELRVNEGSALDFSKLVSNPAVENPTVISGSHFVSNGQKLRFHCGTIPFNPQSGGVPNKYESEELALQLKRHGYNMVRLNAIDVALMQLGPDSQESDFVPTQIIDFHYNEQVLDDLFYLISELKKHDIRIMMDVATSKNAMYLVGNNRSINAGYNFRLDVHFDEKAQNHWKGMVELILNTLNPYTNQALIQDPVLVALTLVNESGIAFNSKGTYSPKLIEAFNEYQENLGGVLASPDLSRWSNSQVSQKLQEFMLLKEINTLDWMTSYLRGVGYKGAITNFNNGKVLQSMGVRNHTEFTAVHAYHDHPTNFVREGSVNKNSSSLQKRLPYVQYFASVRRSGQPFIVDEYNHAYWSKWRREQGVAVPAYASLQDWDGLCAFSDPVVLDYRQTDVMGQPKGARELSMYPFKVGTDPIARANETLSFFLFRRGDVSSSQSHVGISIDEQTYYGPRSIGGRMPQSLGPIALVSKMSSFTSGSQKKDTNYSVRLEEAFDMEWWQVQKELVSKLELDSDIGLSWSRFVSTTKELDLDVNRRTLKVVTPRTEAVVFQKNKHLVREGAHLIELDALRVLSSSGDALVSISSLDGQPLQQSQRMLVIVSTDAKNTGDEFSEDRQLLLNHGSFPVMLKNVEIELEFHNDYAEDLELYALYLNGDRNEMLPLSFNQDRSSVETVINLGSLAEHPTTFFELVRKH